ncbi:MAG: M20/M25/M40 family metallo-hydrolase [Firmicutes bacterium]|nr:M20/M25/M40 family metallo-hydrolase [Bacillota bacterium]
MIGYIILAIVVIFLAVLFIRTAAFKPAPQPPEEFADVEFDKGKAAECLAQLVKCKTVSYVDHSLEDDAEFEKLIGLLPSLYPNVFKTCDFTRLADRGILFRWPGKGSAKGEVPKACKADEGPSVLMAHYDVVPVEEKNWEKDPFCAEVADGVMWGRGTLDTKVTFNGALFAADTLIAKGFVPKKDIYMAFSGQEEINGKGAVHIVDWLMERGIEPAMVVDEGGAVVEGVFPGVSGSCALIGIAEKGLMNVDFKLDTNGGHASAPAPHTPVGRLSRACVDIENNPCKSHFTEPVLKMFDTLGRHSSFLYRMIFANLWCFGGVLDMICKKSGGELNALVRTTTAFTQMSGSKANNVIPPSASMTANVRINPADTSKTVLEHYRSVIKDQEVKIEAAVEAEPSRISRTDCEGWERVCKAIRGTWKGTLVSPYLMVQCSDSRHYGKLSDRVYRFSAMDLTSEERRMIHGNNERIRLDCMARAVEFYIRLIQQC